MFVLVKITNGKNIMACIGCRFRHAPCSTQDNLVGSNLLIGMSDGVVITNHPLMGYCCD